MNAKLFSEAMSEVKDEYYEEAANYHCQKHRWIKWGVMAACLCLIICVATIPRLLNGSNPPVSGDLAPMVYVNNKLYQYADSQPSLTDKESQFIYLGEIESKVSSSQEPKENFQANDDIVGAKVYQYENDIVILIDGKYFLYSNLENAENETVEFEGQLFNKSDLSEETLKWLEWYNSLPPEKQLTVSSIPAELYIDDGAGTVDADQEK
ncbi:entericidin like toxin protein [Bifidobacterium adolescentis]|uniref:Entericidin like toxin protein n=1 Tax=Bifidobacterium adolescentis TaxID=1680 RepID=A0A7J5MUZ9_BIFAD|nr:entericidin like toxin protein [Bifidobacterium adolescentis]KAB5743220.1 entericidin like toxin protein [Bifidobacterium adolescentis]KAB5747335.1 entericidin like toxin protein [Bifidobacterium adolescentis]